ncbi:DUF6221 family protein [Actinomadura viridis]|uniref:DUF6221 family protein n=1 Tax=Actinomadura viridis TaxID=58110 RepID=UPI003693A901
MTLVEFLRAQLDEDERTARRAGDSFRQIGETGVIVATEGDRAEECTSASWAGVAEHIVRHDPARVLAEVDAKRETVRLYEEAVGFVEMAKSHGHEATHYEVAAESYLNVIRCDAAVYADHADYREEWRP